MAAAAVTATPISLRETVSGVIASRLGTELSAEEQADLERGIFNAAMNEAAEKGVRRHWENPDFTEIYKLVARRTVANLDPAAYVGNTRLLARLREGEFKPHDVPFMKAGQLFPENWQALAMEQLKRETAALEGSKEEGCDMFKCRRCGKSRTRYFEMQTRSADEPMTIFIRCLNCGKEWRQ
jgi:DNA-directed RNA polymerase subunit M/transcription elongation factor TFIIS